MMLKLLLIQLIFLATVAKCQELDFIESEDALSIEELNELENYSQTFQAQNDQNILQGLPRLSDHRFLQIIVRFPKKNQAIQVDFPHQSGNRIITHISARTVISGSSASILSGGLGQNNVVIRLISPVGRPLIYAIAILSRAP